MNRYIEITLISITLLLEVKSIDRCIQRNDWPAGRTSYIEEEILNDDLDIDYKITQVDAWFDEHGLGIPTFPDKTGILNQLEFILASGS